MTTKKESKKDAVLRIFESMHEPAQAEEVAIECIRLGVWSESEQQKFLLVGATSFVRKVFKSAGIDGVPRALSRGVEVETSEGGAKTVHYWYQRSLWTFDLVRAAIIDGFRQAQDDVQKLKALFDYAVTEYPQEDWRAYIPDLFEGWGER